MAQMPIERSKIYAQITEAGAKKDLATVRKLMGQVPLSPEMAKIGKQVLGADTMRNSYFNLSEAEEVYGKDWLDR